jgi:cytochrome oxidase assembly protein ShyY1
VNARPAGPSSAAGGGAHTVDGVRFLVRPGWVALTAGVVLFAIVCFTLLAPWQFRRHEEKRTQNEAVRASFSQEARPIESLGPERPEWRQVVLTGSYLPEAEVLARLRTVQGEAAFEVLTPLRLNSGEIVLVDRGYLRPAAGRSSQGRGNQVPDYAPAPTGEVTVAGRLRRDETGNREPVVDGGRRQVYAINAKAVGELVDLPLQPGYVQLNADQPGVLGPLPLPRLDAGPYLSYALQWLAFGAMALVGWVLLLRRELTERAAPAAGTDRDRERG